MSDSLGPNAANLRPDMQLYQRAKKTEQESNWSLEPSKALTFFDMGDFTNLLLMAVKNS